MLHVAGFSPVTWGFQVAGLVTDSAFCNLGVSSCRLSDRQCFLAVPVIQNAGLQGDAEARLHWRPRDSWLDIFRLFRLLKAAKP